MVEDYNLIHGEFQHLTLEGSAYEVGRRQGELLKNDQEMRERVEGTISSFLSELGLPPSGESLLKMCGFQSFEEMQSVFEEHCPGLNEEMQGFADGLGVEIRKVPFYGASYQAPASCSQMAVLSTATRDNHVYVGRSYEWNHTEEDLRMCTTRVKGKAKHVGFSIFLFGRADGMNEHGVGVTFTGGGIFGVPFKQKGFQSQMVIRSILDNCRSISDALELLQNMPVSGFFNLLTVDKESNAALVEFADGACDIRQINNDSVDKILFSTNHYTLPATMRFNERNCGIIANSKRRYQLLTSTLRNAELETDGETLKAILSKKFPEGVCDHYYSGWFGTVWSSVYDLTALEADICFGAPTHNEWQSFTLDGSVGVKAYPAIFPDIQGEWPY